jgi:hypothetical protein
MIGPEGARTTGALGEASGREAGRASGLRTLGAPPDAEDAEDAEDGAGLRDSVAGGSSCGVNSSGVVAGTKLATGGAPAASRASALPQEAHVTVPITA